MPRRCTICDHGGRASIDAALISGAPLRDIAGRHGVSKSALERHRAGHLPAHLAMAREAEEVAHANGLLSQVRHLQGRAYGILDKAEDAGDLRTALSAIREARGNLELLAKLLGNLDERPTVNLNISPEWLELRAVIVTTLEPHPEALRAVVGALEVTGYG
jgi:hypothetical protein